MENENNKQVDQEKIHFHYKVDQLYKAFNALQSFDDYVLGQNINRERFQRRAMELMNYIKDLKGININYKVWPKYVELCEMLITYSITPGIPELINLKRECQKDVVNKNSLHGLKCNLSPEQIKNLYNKIKGNYIDIATNLVDFISAFTPEPIPESFKPVKWIKLSSKNKNWKNKNSFIDMVKLAGSKVDLKQCNELFEVDLTPANVSNNKTNDHSEYYPELQSIFISL